MPRKRYSPEQIVTKLRQSEVELGRGLRMPQVCKKLGISEQTYYRWRKEYGGLGLDQAKRLKALEQENLRLKKLVADQALDNTILKVDLHAFDRRSTAAAEHDRRFSPIHSHVHARPDVRRHEDAIDTLEPHVRVLVRADRDFSAAAKSFRGASARGIPTACRQAENPQRGFRCSRAWALAGSRRLPGSRRRFQCRCRRDPSGCRLGEANQDAVFQRVIL